MWALRSVYYAHTCAILFSCGISQLDADCIADSLPVSPSVLDIVGVATFADPLRRLTSVEQGHTVEALTYCHDPRSTASKEALKY
jgi:hypothetical protein